MGTSRVIKIGDALSQLLNVAFWPRHHETTANESLSGRAYRQKWVKTQKFLDWVFSPWEQEHCRLSHEADVRRAAQFLNAEKARK